MVLQLSNQDIKLPDVVLRYRAFKSVNLGEVNEKLIMATIKDIKWNEMMVQIKKKGDGC